MIMSNSGNTKTDRLHPGFSFREDREIVAMTYISLMTAVIFAAVALILHIMGEKMLLVTYRYHALALISLLIIWFVRKHWITLARIIMLTLFPFTILLLPSLAGLREEDFYVWFPYVPTGLSLIPHFILHPSKHRAALITSLTAYFLLAVMIDNYLLAFSDGSETIIPVILEHRFYYNLVPLLLYVFINLALGLLFTRNIRYEGIMRKQQEELLQAEKLASLGTLSAGVAHEINNPLNFISGSLEVLKKIRDRIREEYGGSDGFKEKIGDPVDQLVENASEGIRRASDIVTKLGMFSQPAMEPQESIPMNRLIDKVLRKVESKLPYYIMIRKDILPDQKIRCHVQQITLVCVQIISNAIDALESKPDKKREVIEITTSEVGSGNEIYSRISIANSGPPITDAELKQIFDPFFSSSQDKNKKGMGMSLSYMILKQHGGRIEVGNDEGGMVRFDILVPVSD